MINEAYHAFLRDHLHADQTRHTGRAFLDHLTGTYALLENWGNCAAVCDAGLFHSIYGTAHFLHGSWPLDQRGVIRALIGEEAEQLAYLFCVTDRPRAFLNNAAAPRPRLTDRHSGIVVEVSPVMLGQLLEIEAANLLEQGAKNFAMLRRLLRTQISAEAKAAINSYLVVAYNEYERLPDSSISEIPGSAEDFRPVAV